MTRLVSAPTRFETAVRVRYDEAGPDGLLRSSAVLRYVQDVAWLHSEGAGFGRDWYGARKLMWLVRSVELDMLGAPEYGTPLTVTTEVVGFRRVWARRLSEVRREDGGFVARVLIDWVLLGGNGVPTRVPIEIVDAFPVPIPSFDPARVMVPTPAADAYRHDFAVARRDLDPMAHVNNAVYLDYLEEGVELAGGTDSIRAVPRRYRLEFVLPAEPGARLAGLAWQADGRWFYRLESVAGPELFRGALDPSRGAA